MCTIAGAIQGAQVGGNALGAISSDLGRHQQLRASAANARLQRSQAIAKVSQEAEASAQKNFELERAAIALKGEAKAENLGDRSVRALARAVGFELGQDKAVVARNQEIANLVASARLRGVDITRFTEKLQIGRHGYLATVSDGLGRNLGTASPQGLGIEE